MATTIYSLAYIQWLQLSLVLPTGGCTRMECNKHQWGDVKRITSRNIDPDALPYIHPECSTLLCV